MNFTPVQWLTLSKSYFTSIFNSVLDKHAPCTKTKCSSTRWFTAEFSILFYPRNKEWALARRTKDPCHWLAFRQLRNKCNPAIRKGKTDYYMHFFPNSSYNLSKFQKIVKSTSNNSSNPLPAYVVYGLTQITDSHEICTAFNNHFAASCQLFDSLSPKGWVEEQRLSSFNINTEVNQSFSLLPVSNLMVADAQCSIDVRKIKG